MFSFLLDLLDILLLLFIIQVETALISSEHDSSGYLLAVACGTALAILCLSIFGVLIWRHRNIAACSSALSLSPPNDTTRHEEEKSNNLQNEENIRRYANPIKTSATSLRGSIELNFQPSPEVALSTMPGPSAVYRSQPIFPPSDNNFKQEQENNKTPHRGSQILFYKAQNPDMKKNIVGSIDSPHKDFGKRAINCQQSITPILNQEVHAVHI